MSSRKLLTPKPQGQPHGEDPKPGTARAGKKRAQPPVPRSLRSTAARLGLHPATRSVIAALVVIVVWQLIVVTSDPSSLALPSPLVVWRALTGMAANGFEGSSLQLAIGLTAMRVAVGFVAACLGGVLIGAAMGVSRHVRAVVTPYITLFRPVPPFAWLALLVIWFGIGEFPKILLIFLGSVTVVALNTMDGVSRVPPEYRETGRVLGANRRQMFTSVVLPAALPQILSGARVALIVAWSGVIAAELVAAKAGIGVIILDSSNYLRMDQTFAGIILLSACGATTDWFMRALQEAVAPWGNR